MSATIRVRWCHVCLLALLCAGCGETAGPANRADAGPASILAEPSPTRLLPTVDIRVAPVAGWPQGVKPMPAHGLAVHAYAAGFERPRWIHVLPNGDVLVAETARPAAQPSGLRAWLTSHAQERDTAAAAGTDRITLLRDADGDGIAEVRTTFLSGLEAPSAIALIGNQLYVAGPGAILRFAYESGATQITAPGTEVAEWPADAVNDQAGRAAVLAIVPDDTPGSRGAGLRLASCCADGGIRGSRDSRPAPAGYKVVVVPFAGSKPAGGMEDVLTGFVSQDGKAYGRPVGVAVDKTGAILVVDDIGNTVWRVAPARAVPRAPRREPLADSTNKRLIPAA